MPYVSAGLGATLHSEDRRRAFFVVTQDSVTLGGSGVRRRSTATAIGGAGVQRGGEDDGERGSRTTKGLPSTTKSRSPAGSAACSAGWKPRHSRDELEAIASALNGRPCKTLGWKTPAEALDDYLCLIRE